MACSLLRAHLPSEDTAQPFGLLAPSPFAHPIPQSYRRAGEHLFRGQNTPSEALDAQIEAFQPEFEAYDEDGDESEDLYVAIEEKADPIEGESGSLVESLAETYLDDVAIGGAIVTIDREGKLCIERNLIRKEDMSSI